MTTREFLFAVMFALASVACGGGDTPDDGNEPPPDGNGDVRCGDNTCDRNESSSSCPADCPPDERCGDGTCTPNTDPALTEDCATCAADCGCASGQVCRSWKILGRAEACGEIPEDPTRYCGSACGPANPLIDAIPGRWRVEGAFDDLYDIIVDPSLPTCDIVGHEAGDACVLSNGLFLVAVLDGTRLFLESPPAGYFLEGQVLEEGRRLEYDEGAPEGPFDHRVWVKVEE